MFLKHSSNQEQLKHQIECQKVKARCEREVRIIRICGSRIEWPLKTA